ncbi:hypothetical protein RN001_002542 [Aquatica leii]|uniref:Uncharacterized protein n=1 Tax=Aquatica leii TaxID=1421715 RepID=A0AAN7PMI2_9COLE|nr:hypothetical protein RN001_002542 [Aquatica leii]
MFITSVTVVLAFLVISNAQAGPLSNSLLPQQREIFAQGSDGGYIRRRFVRDMNSESLENSESKYAIHNAAFYNYFPYGARQYGHHGPKASSFNTHHHGPYSHQYHNQFFDHDHHSHHFSYDHHPHHNFHHHHHHHDCDHSNSDSSESSSDETYGIGNNKPYPSGTEKESPLTSAPAKSTDLTPTTTTETTFDIDVRLGSSN